MDPRARIMMAAAQLDRASYYELLSVPRGATRQQLQQAFHRFALAYHPDRHIDEAPEVREAAKKIFERGVEAYSVLRDPKAAKVYDDLLNQGGRRLGAEHFESLSRRSRPQDEAQPAGTPAPSQRKAPPKPLAAHMRTPEGREVAQRIARLVAQRRYRDAYLQMGMLESVEGDNPAVRVLGAKLSKLLKQQR